MILRSNAFGKHWRAFAVYLRASVFLQNVSIVASGTAIVQGVLAAGIMSVKHKPKVYPGGAELDPC